MSRMYAIMCTEKRGEIMDKNNAIEVRNMSKRFKLQYDKPQTLKERLITSRNNKVEYHEVLKNISLDIKKGETVALIGTNGSGKSTLLKLMTKIIYPQEGTIKTQGKLTSLLELGAGFHPDFTGRENIYFNASIFGLTRKQIDARMDEIIKFSELEEFIDNPIRTYSSGMYMRLAFSIAINVDADILLIDEILAVGDQHFTEKCYDKLKELRNSDKTIVIVTHSLDVVKDICDRAIWIYRGEFRLDGDPTYVIGEYLKQVRLDHKEEMRKRQNEVKEKYRGVCFIDTPKSFQKIAKGTSTIEIRGWEMSESLDSVVKVFIDENEIQSVTRQEREDVLSAYEDAYGGYASNDLPGWSVQANIENLNVGNHKIKVEVYDHKERLICDKEIAIEIGE